MIEIEYNEEKARRSSILKTSVDISLLDYVQKLITSPELADEMWTKDLLSVLENFLSSKRQYLLIAYVDRHTSTLQLLHSIPSMAKSIDKIYNLCYFIRKNDSTEFITSIDAFLKQILFGFINGKSIHCLTALVSTLFGPLFMDNSTIQDTTFYEIQYKHITSRTYLFIPKDGVDKTIEELRKDKALVTRFESVMVKWYHQLKEVLLVQDRLMNNNEQSAGIHEEISCWQECLMDLHFIRKQLQRTELRNIIQVLVASKSAYVHQFLQAENQVQEFIEYVEDCLKFLKILDQPSSQLNDISLEKLKDVITDIFYRILITWHHSKFFATSARIKLVIGKVNNQIIGRCTRAISVKRLFQGYIISTQSILQESFQIVDNYMETCLHILTMHDKNSNKPLMTDDFQKDVLFYSVQLFRQRLNEIDEICECMKLFGWHRDNKKESLPLFGGIQGDEYRHSLEQSQQAFDRALSIVKRYSKYILDISTDAHSIWSQEFQRFMESIHEIELIIVKLINKSMTKAITLEQIIDILQVFANFQSRTNINHVLIDKTRDIYRLFLSQIDDIRSQIGSHQTLDDEKIARTYFDLFLPHHPAKAMWINSLIERITNSYHLLNQSSNLPFVLQRNEIKLAYEKLLIFAENIQKRIYQEWWTTASELQPKKLLQKPFLKENTEKKHFIDVYFDPQITIALNESVWWIRLNYEIPFSLTDVYNTRKSYRQMKEETHGFIRKFNKTIESLADQELCLFEERIRMIFKKLQPAFIGRVNYVNENTFHDFALEANRIIDQFMNMVTLFKENYVKSCAKCVTISQKLFIKIDPGIIFNYTTFTDLLKSVNQASQHSINDMYGEIALGIRVQQMIFKDDPDKILQCWDHWLSSIDCMFEKALLMNITDSLEQLSYVINGDSQNKPTPFLTIELCLNAVETTIGNIKYTLRFQPSLEQLTETLNEVSKIQLTESIQNFGRLCDLFSYYPFQRESYHVVIDNYPIKQNLQNKIALGISNAISEIEKYVDNNWFHFRQLWEVDKESFIAVYESEHTDLQGLEADIARYTEVANNINNQEAIVNLNMIQIDCSSFKVSLVQICHEWQQSLIQIVLVRLEKDLQMISTLIKDNTEKINILPKIYDEIPTYQQFIDELKTDVLKIESRLPLINEEVALLLRYEIEIDPKLLEQHRSLSHIWNNYKMFLDESIVSFKRIKEAFKIQLHKEQEKTLNEIFDLQKSFKITGPHQADIPVWVALNQCEEIEEYIKNMENDEKRLKIAYRIFNLDMNFSKELPNLKKDIEILKSIWLIAKEYEEMLNKWKTTKFDQINMIELNDFAQNQHKKLLKMSREYKEKNWNILDNLRNRVDTFRRILPLIESLHNPHLRSRHWEQIKYETEKYFDYKSNQFTLEEILSLHFEDNIQLITEISENASKEYSIERILEKIVQIWNEMKFETTMHKTNVFKIKAPDEIIQYVEEHTAQISTIKGARYVKPFQHEIDYWEKSIAQISELCDGLFNVQRQWLYMEGIFTSDDVQRQLSHETNEFKHVNVIWQDEIIEKIRENPNSLFAATKLNLFDKIQNLLKYLENIQKKMEDYLETKRSIFPRFYFISNEELVEILSLSRQPELIQIHLKKLFDNIKSLRLLIKKNILANGILSNEDEQINLISALSLEGNVENWLNELELKMQITVKEYLKNCLIALKVQLKKRDKWVKDWPSQCCVTASEIEWTSATAKALLNCQADGSLKPLKILFRTQVKILDRYSNMSRLPLDKIIRLRVVGIITKEVHGRDVIERLIKTQTMDIQSFEWQMQLRFYWERHEQNEDCIIRQTITKFTYYYEYLGCTSRLVISPLTDRCYITLTTALHLFRGGSSKGPAEKSSLILFFPGTGKTETIKDLGKTFAIYVVVQNCSESLDYKSMGKMFSGFAQSGTWGCFDEFNRINIEVLSVVAQQIHSILTALSSKQKRFVFEGKEIPLLPQVGIFITMNPGYAGRTELPDNLKSMFRPVSMVVPDSVYIAENFLFSEGFQNTRNLARKVYTLYQLSTQQLSKQDHYDFGLRSLTAVLRYAGEKKRTNIKMTDNEVLLLSMLDMNAPKMTAQDLPLFQNILGDLFPGTDLPKIDYSKLIEAIENEMNIHNLQITQISIEKVIQLYETHHSRHSVMLVGKTLSGKTTTWKLLKYSLTTLNKQGLNEYNKVVEYPINPKAVSLGELYGQFNLATNEWNDGILSTIMRQVCADEKPDEKLILFDAPVDTSWIESMNSLMDDNKLLTLANGERISMPSQVTLLFETEDLSTASPATVSRAGIVYCDYEKLRWKPYLESWLRQRESQDLQTELSNCITKYLEPIMKYKHIYCKELIPIHELNGIISLTKLFDTFWYTNEIQIQINENEAISGRLIEMWFVFCLMWSIAASVNDEGRKKIDIFFRETEGTFPNKDTVFEFYVDAHNRTWIHWEEQLKEGWTYNSEIPFYKIIVPNVDTIRYEYLIYNLLLNKHQVLLVGAIGTGKTTIVENVLKKLDSNLYNTLMIHMSAQTTPKMLQDMFEINLEKRAKTIFVPMNGKQMITLIDDLNMPNKETYGSQPSLELIRMWIDYEFWYDRKTQGIKFIKDMCLLTAMGPPGGGRHQISQRLQSRFNLINMTFPFNHEIGRIFGTMLSQQLQRFDDEVKHLDQTVTKATIDLYQTIENKYLPTPTKIHYTFNMRDISRMFEGLLLCNRTTITTKVEFLRLWIHEAHRVYSDRFMTNSDHELFIKILSEKLGLYFDQVYHNVCYNRETPIYSDIMRKDGLYEEIRDYDKLKLFLEQSLQRYNETSLMLAMDLVMFRDAILNICRMTRVLRRPRGNLLLLGIGGSGRQSLLRLAAFICDIVIFQIEIGRRYGYAEFKEDLRRLMKLCSISNRETVFLFVDTQIIDTFFLEDINALLHTGEVPSLFRNEDIQEIRNQLSSIIQQQGIPDTNLNVMQLFYNRVKSNLHIAICMSPYGETFRNYIRMYPALVNCTTVINFSEWSHEALIDVAHYFLSKYNFESQHTERTHRILAHICAFIHLSSKTLAARMKDELRREIYITPTNYLQFVSNYSRLYEGEKVKLQYEYNRLQMGIIKVAETREKVAEISLELEKKKALVAQLQRECEEFLGNIVEQKNSASERERQVQAFGVRIGEEEIRCQTIAAAAHEEFTEVEPLLIKANEALEQLTKRDIGEVKAYIHPPSQVEKVMKALMILKGKEDTWEEAKKDLANVDFIKTLTKFPKDDITDRTLRRMQPFINDMELVPEKLKTVSSAATALCTWIRAIESYARVYRIVQPKKDRYQKALFELNEKQNLLEQSKNELLNIQTNIEKLRLDYESKLKEKDVLQRNADETAMFLDRATKLLDGVAEKRTIWDTTSNELKENLDNLLGNSLLACAFLSYMGPFLSNYRDEIIHQIWEEELTRNDIHFKTDFNFAKFMTTPSVIRQWNIQGLPRDNFSTENAILATRTFSYPLFIDPQSQATNWIKQMEKSNGLKIIDLQVGDYMKTIEECIKTGRPCLFQNIHEDIPQTLNPILLKSIKKTNSTDSNLVLQLGDREIVYNPSFRFYLSTRLYNPKYKPEIYSKINIINFAIKEQGLEEQLLGKNKISIYVHNLFLLEGIVVRKEKPDLENSKDNCIVNISNKHKEKEILEEQFLRLLSETEGSLLENVNVFQALDLSKQSQNDINETLKINEDLEIKIDLMRDNYRSVAQRAAILFFVLQDLTSIDPMYQYSLDAYIQLFVLSIEKSPRSLKLNERIEKLNDYHTYTVYKYGCRGVFERHKLLFSFHMCTKLMDAENRINHDEYQFLIRAHTLTIDRETQFPNPFPVWLNEIRWDEMSELIRLPDYRFLRDSFDQFPKDWKEWYTSEEAEKAPLPGTIDSLITEFGRMLIVRCLRPDRITHCVLNFVTLNIGSKFVEPPILQLTSILEESNKRSPLIFLLSPGVDPASKLQQLAEDKMMAQSRYFTLSLGQGQAPRARKLLEAGMKKGHWVFLANCHLSISWLPELEKIVEQLQTIAVHNDFRLWLSSSPTIDFPISILQIGLKITNESQKGIKANMKRLYELITPEQFQRVKQDEKYRKLLFTLAFFHSIIIERKKFLQLGWNIHYTFNDSDFQISENLLAIYLDTHDKTPFEALKYLIAIVIYGGHCTDEWDMRLLNTYIDSYIRNEVVEVMYYKLSSLAYYYMPRDGTFKSYKDFINAMPTTDHPEAFGQHPNADIASQIQESKTLFDTLLMVLPQKTSATVENEVENEVAKATREMLKLMPHEIDIEAVKKYMLIDASPLSIVLLQEAERYNTLLSNITIALNDLLKSIEGFVVMTVELDELFKCIYEGRLPYAWQRTYRSLKPLPAWFQDLRQRINFFKSWIENQRQPIVYWISAFSYPTAFLTAILQRTARKDQIGIDQLSWEFEVNQTEDKYLSNIDDGVYVTGLYLEGAGWDRKQGTLCEAKSMELVTIIPTIHFKPVEHKKKSAKGFYIAPCYYSSSRVGPFIVAVELKTGSMPVEHWIKRATALLMNLDH
ncbi:unnamed protein product [Rotaria socialis]|uniref:Dynein heavy chain n=1 Tax=Rotaria socialis TaxID=392032 RepID=A0A821JGT1_9BILA|nr:unnamed protein product [Rotaria socialis]